MRHVRYSEPQQGEKQWRHVRYVKHGCMFNVWIAVLVSTAFYLYIPLLLFFFLKRYLIYTIFILYNIYIILIIFSNNLLLFFIFFLFSFHLFSFILQCFYSCFLSCFFFLSFFNVFIHAFSLSLVPSFQTDRWMNKNWTIPRTGFLFWKVILPFLLSWASPSEMPVLMWVCLCDLAELEC